MRNRRTIGVILMLSVVGCSRSTVVDRLLEAASREEPTGSFWVGGQEVSRLYAVREWEVLSSRPLSEVIASLADGFETRRDHMFEMAAEARKQAADAQRGIAYGLSYKPPAELEKAAAGLDDMGRVYQKALDASKKTKGVAYKVRIASSTAGGSPVVKAWTAIVVETSEGPRVSSLVDEDELRGLDVDRRCRAVLLMVGERDPETLAVIDVLAESTDDE